MIDNASLINVDANSPNISDDYCGMVIHIYPYTHCVEFLIYIPLSSCQLRHNTARLNEHEGHQHSIKTLNGYYPDYDGAKAIPQL